MPVHEALRQPHPRAVMSSTAGQGLMNISLCIATCHRSDRLHALLGDLITQQFPVHEIIVVDNDADGSARLVVERYARDNPPCPIHYAIEPIRSIALARNRAVALSRGP